MPLRFVFAIHDHQPIGNFGSVFEGAYRDAYAPFLELLDQYPEIPVSLHTSGPLMEWLVANRPEYLDRLRRLVSRGQVEILGGGFYEPILPMIPPRDRVRTVRALEAARLAARPISEQHARHRLGRPAATSSLHRYPSACSSKSSR